MSKQRRNRRRNGQIVVFAPLLLLVLAAICALATDVGRMAVEHARLQNAADAASLAAAAELVSARVAGYDEYGARLAASTEGEAIHNANYSGAGVEVQFGAVEDGAFTVLGDGDEATAVRVTASRNADAPTGAIELNFAAILGVSQWEVAAPAVSAVESHIRGVRSGLSPFAVPEDQLVPPGQMMTFYPAGDDGNGNGNGVGNSQTTAGNWGLLDLNGGNNNNDDLRDWILNGYDGEFDIGDAGFLWVDGCPGWRATLGSEISQMIGQPMIMVIYDQVTGNGSNAEYRCIGFLVATIISCQTTGNDKHCTCRVEEIRGLHDLITGGTYESPNMRKIELVM